MKLERISDNQIRCTLNRTDLMDREIKISELAYGTDKAKELFRDMMIQASDELGFEADDIPLIIEAIPLSGDCIVLIITKVEDPEELDTRFSRFTPFSGEDEADDETDDETASTEQYTGADEILDLFKRIQESVLNSMQGSDHTGNPAISEQAQPSVPTPEAAIEITRIYSFHSLSEVSLFAEAAVHMHPGTSALYKNEQTGLFYMVLQKRDTSPEDFNRLCNLATEYGTREPVTYATDAYYREHYTCIVKENAIQILAEI